MIGEFEQIGLTKGEINTYLALIKKSPQSKMKLAISANISSSKIYEVAERLVKKGLIGKITKNNVVYYQVNNPESLHEIILEKEKQLKKEEEIISNLIPQLNKIKSSGEEQRFEIIEGQKGLRQLLDETLNEMESQEELLGFGIEMDNITTLHQYHRKRTKKNINQRLIFSEKPSIETKYKNKKSRIIPNITDIGIGITNKKIILHSKESTLVIENKKFNSSFRKIFEELWKVAKP